MTRSRYMILLWLFLALVTYTFAQGAKNERDPLRVFRDVLTGEGFIVSPGAAEVWNPLGDFCSGKISDAWLANSEPYLILKVPESAGVQSLTHRFNIRHDEAIVMIGQTPPPAKYFGFYTFLYTRFYPDTDH